MKTIKQQIFSFFYHLGWAAIAIGLIGVTTAYIKVLYITIKFFWNAI